MNNNLSTKNSETQNYRPEGKVIDFAKLRAIAEKILEEEKKYGHLRRSSEKIANEAYTA